MLPPRNCFVVIAVAVVAAACGGPAGGGSPIRLSIATGGTGGVFYPYGGGVAKVLSARLPGVEATAEVTAASVDNLKFLKQGTSDLAFTMADMAKDGLSGRGSFKDFGAVPLRALAVLYPSASASEVTTVDRVSLLWTRRRIFARSTAACASGSRATRDHRGW